MNNSSNSEKKAILQEFIAEDDIYVCINAKDDDVIVPNNHKGNFDLRLVLSLNFVNKPSFQDDFVEVILRFGGVPRKCILPYKAIWGVFNSDLKRLFFWQEHMPDEVATKIHEFQESQGGKTNTLTKKSAALRVQEEHQPESPSVKVPEKQKKPTFSVIENKNEIAPEKAPSKKRSRAHLKVLK